MKNTEIQKIKALGLENTENELNSNKKNIAITYISSTVNEKFINLNFKISQTNLTKFNSKIFVQEMNAVNEYAVNQKVTLKNVKEQNITVSFDKNKEFDKYSWQEGFVYQASITCDGVSDETEEFKMKFTNDKQESKKTCYCDRDFTVEELKNIIISLRSSEKTGQKQKLRDKKNTKNFAMGEPVIGKDGKEIFVEMTQYDELGEQIFHLKMNEKIADYDANFDLLTKELNKAFKDYKINTCIRKAHFLGQAYLETQRFSKTYEGNPSSSVSGGEFYRGRGFLQLTHDYNYKELYKAKEKKEPSDIELKEFVPKIATSMKLACQGSAWYWNKLKAYQYADIDDPTKVSASINYPKALNGNENDIASINHLSERKLYTNKLKQIFNYEKFCKNKK